MISPPLQTTKYYYIFSGSQTLVTVKFGTWISKQENTVRFGLVEMNWADSELTKSSIINIILQQE